MDFFENLLNDMDEADIYYLQEVPMSFEPCVYRGYCIYCAEGDMAETFGRVATVVKQDKTLKVTRVHAANSIVTLSIKLNEVGIRLRNVYMPHTGHETAVYLDRLGYFANGLDNRFEIIWATT